MTDLKWLLSLPGYLYKKIIHFQDRCVVNLQRLDENLRL